MSHAKNLATFVTIYKTLMVIQRRSQGTEWKKDSFLAGLIGGWIVFGEDNPINQQVGIDFLSLLMLVLFDLIFPHLPFSFFKI